MFQTIENWARIEQECDRICLSIECWNADPVRVRPTRMAGRQLDRKHRHTFRPLHQVSVLKRQEKIVTPLHSFDRNQFSHLNEIDQLGYELIN